MFFLSSCHSAFNFELFFFRFSPKKKKKISKHEPRIKEIGFRGDFNWHKKEEHRISKIRLFDGEEGMEEGEGIERIGLTVFFFVCFFMVF